MSYRSCPCLSRLTWPEQKSFGASTTPCLSFTLLWHCGWVVHIYIYIYKTIYKQYVGTVPCTFEVLYPSEMHKSMLWLDIHTHTLTQCVFHQPIRTTYCPAQCGSRLHLCGFLVRDFAWTNEIHRTYNCICKSKKNKQQNTKTLSDTSCSIFHHPLHYAAHINRHTYSYQVYINKII